MKIAHDKARGPDADLLPITEAAVVAQCSVREILIEAGNGDALLYVALGRLTAHGVDTLGNKITNERRWAGGFVEFLPLYVPTIIQRGEADIVYYPLEEALFPNGYDSNSILYWCLESPQRISLAQIYVQRGHIAANDEAVMNGSGSLDCDPRANRKNHDITAERGTRRLILDYWDQVEKLHGTNVDARRVRTVIEKNRSNSDPALKDVKTFSNALRALRNEKLIPEKTPG